MDAFNALQVGNTNDLRAAEQGIRNIQSVQEDKEKLRKVAGEFESLFVKQMLNSMRETLDPEARLIDGGMTEEVFEDMLYSEYAKNMARHHSFGIADMIVQQFTQ